MLALHHAATWVMIVAAVVALLGVFDVLWPWSYFGGMAALLVSIWTYWLTAYAHRP